MTDFYARLGLETVVNARGPATILGNCTLAPEVAQAMVEASSAFVVMAELEERAGQVIAGITGAEAGYVTSGASAALTLAAAACIARADVATMNRLPDTRGIPNQILIHRAHRYDYDHALRAAGADLVEFGYPDLTFPGELEASISEEVVAVAFNAAGSYNVLPLSNVVAIAHAHGLPVIVDAALAVPPASNLRSFVAAGADLVAFSGGKWIGGPAASGFLAGRADLIQSVALQHQDMDVRIPTWPLRHLIDEGILASPPHQGLGRSLKVGKEEIAGLLVALNAYVERDAEEENRRWRSCAEAIVSAIRDVPGVLAEVREGDEVHPTRLPVVVLKVDPIITGRSAYDVVKLLLESRPRVYVDESQAWNDVIRIVPSSLGRGEADIVAGALLRAFHSLSKGQ
jgi:L-seryl-tRNA(Ser) seleniumtransferase